MHSSSVREQAQKLRLLGQSYNEISQELKISKSTLHSWFLDLQLSANAQERLSGRVREGSLRGLLKRNKLQTHSARQRAAQNKKVGREMIYPITNKELLLIGTALYWGEGYKKTITVNGRKRTYHPVSLSNSDPEIIRVFMRFLRECFQVQDSDIEINIRIYEHMNAEELIRFWQDVTSLPRENFSKIYYGVSISSQRRRGYNRLPYGTAQVRVNSTVLYHRIMGLIEGIIKKT